MEKKKINKTKTFTLEGGILKEKGKTVVFKLTDAYGNIIDTLSSGTVRAGGYVVIAGVDKFKRLLVEHHQILKVDGDTIHTAPTSEQVAYSFLTKATEEVVKKFLTVKDQELTEKI